VFEVGDVILRKTAVRYGGQWVDRDKMHLCICMSEGWYFYINSRDHWAFSWPLAQHDARFLQHDSFVGCGQLQEIDDSFFQDENGYLDGDCQIIGRLSVGLLQSLARFIPTVGALTEEEKEIIINALLDAASAKP
jgi:hypothetical protein